jgi:lantibiotic modifying enzyme
MARAYRVWKDERYLESCKRCADVVWERGLLKKGPGICHGVAGNGYVFLCLYRLTDDPVYLNKARCFADFMFSEEFQSARTPDAPYSLYEGLAGAVCFLIDLLDPATAEFPFYTVFDEIKA